MNKWIDPPSPSDAPRLITDASDGASFMPRGNRSAFRKADGRFSRITDVRSYAEESGWIDDSGTDLLYVSSGNDPRPLFALSPNSLTERGLESSEAPSFFVFVDHTHPEVASEPNLRDPEDEAVAIHLEWSEVVQVAGFSASLLFLTITPSGEDSQRGAVLRVKAGNEEVGILAEAEGWVPRWFVGICDGCSGFGDQIEDPRLRGEDRLDLRCENQVAPAFHSIPLNLGSRYWLTDHLRDGGNFIRDFGHETLEPGQHHDLPTGHSVRLLHAWTDWPSRRGDFGVPSLFEAIPKGGHNELV